MPWCEECAKYWAPSAMNEDGTCPTCGRSVAAQQPITAKNVDVRKLAAGGGDEDDVKAPWHFKLLMVMLVAYLGWRVIYLFL
ncbi:MAG: hypothetical protein Q8M22_02805 [Actinomycetota bacterium]|nr:hypothetical protein [Actinomycetota bacterium]